MRLAMTSPEENQQAHKPGDTVPVSGIYTAVHREHRSAHEVVAIRGEQFPQCRLCKDEVRFYVTRLVPHMMHDFDLTGPDRTVINKRARAAKRGS
jgi:hypothetical protein